MQGGGQDGCARVALAGRLLQGASFRTCLLITLGQVLREACVLAIVPPAFPAEAGEQLAYQQAHPYRSQSKKDGGSALCGDAGLQLETG